MPDPAPNAELLRSLGRLVRGLSALFWGLPVTMLACFYTARMEPLRTLGIAPPVLTTGLLVYGLWQMSDFQKQERVWHAALDRARLLALVNFGLSPFLYWSNRVPGNLFFLAMVVLMALSALLLLASVNLVLRRLGAMLADETLRLETRQFTALNLGLMLATLLLALFYVGAGQIPILPLWLAPVLTVMEHGSLWFIVVLILLPLAMTMALLWKTKEVILDNVFGGSH